MAPEAYIEPHRLAAEYHFMAKEDVLAIFSVCECEVRVLLVVEETEKC